jgi:CPA2 family monovalent cation:H+ antiporter-2
VLAVAVGLAQVGEFSFILAALAAGLGLLPEEGYGAVVAVSLLSITVNPLLHRALGPVERWLRRRPGRRAPEPPAAAGGGSGKGDGPVAVVVGHGPVGKTVTRILRDFGVRPVVVELNVDTVTHLVAAGQPAVYGDAGRPDVLRAAGVERAEYVIVTLPDLPSRIPVIVAARELAPRARVIVRARYLTERSFLEEIGATAASYEEAEAAVALAGAVLRAVGASEDRIEAESRAIRGQFAIRPAQSPSPPAS